MTTPRQALLRPIEITAANKTITISATDYTVGERVYANIFDLINALIGTALAKCYITSDWRVALSTTSGTASITKTALSDLLGFTGAEASAVINIGGTNYNVRTATYAPAFCWASKHQSSNTERWLTDSDMEFSGSQAADGNLYGVTTTTRESLVIKWPWEPAISATPSAAQSSYTGSDTYLRFPEKYSNFWTTATGARSAYATAASSGNICVKGCYFVPRIADWLGSSPTFDWTSVGLFTSGGTNFDVTTAANRDDYVFCSVSDSPKKPESQNGLNSFYDVSVSLTTAVAPAWAIPT